MRIAILPARGGSKRVKNKNIIDFLGKPIIAYPLQAAKESGLFDTIHVSTDSQEIAQAVAGLGFPVDFMRDAESANDHSPVMEAIQFVLKEYKKKGKAYDSYTLIFPCSPLLLAQDLIQSHALFEKHKKEIPVLAVCEYPAPVEWAYEMKNDSTASAAAPEKLIIRSQDLKKKYYDTGTFIIQKTSDAMGSDKKIFDRVLPYILPKERAVDIDSLEDIEFAKILMRGLKN